MICSSEKFALLVPVPLQRLTDFVPFSWYD